MPETSLNEEMPLTNASVGDADLHVDNGDIVDGNGNPVTLGAVNGDEVEQSFGVANRGINSVKGASPTGDLRTDSSSNIVVEGHGTVTLEGPLREVSTAGNTDGTAETITTNNSGNIFIKWTETGTKDTKRLFNLLENEESKIYNLDYKNDADSYSNYQIDNSVISWEEGLEDTGQSYSVGWKMKIYWSQTEFENDNPSEVITSEYNFTQDGFGNRAISWDTSSDPFSPPSSYDGSGVVEITPVNDGDGDGNKEYIYGEAYENGEITFNNISISFQYDWTDTNTPIISFF